MLHLDGIQPVFDKSIINTDVTTAELEVGTPILREVCFTPDEPWEKDLEYMNVIKDGDIYRGYYLTHFRSNDVCPKYQYTEDEILENKWLIHYVNSFVCYVESDDGITWRKPSLGICEYRGSADNNILLRSEDLAGRYTMLDNFFVFKDTNPNAPSDERYKALAFGCEKLPPEIKSTFREGLSYYASADGIHFRFMRVLNISEGTYDTLNTCSYDEALGKYVVYYRGWHGIPEGGRRIEGVRDVKRAYSTDFVNWSGFEQITFDDGVDSPMYTNQIMRYYRNPNILIGFPTRYVERKEWTSNYDELCGKEARRERMSHGHPREGLAVTDCLFMYSRDGEGFHRFNEALFTPGQETPTNWIYGDCYPAYMMTETLSDDGVNREISMFVPKFTKIDVATGETQKKLYRYTLRRDGFAYYRAKASGATVGTIPFILDGSELYINFATSAFGSVRVTLTASDGATAVSPELFGNSDERRVHFDGCDISALVGKEVTLTFDMKDACLYSFEIRSSADN